MNNLYILYLNSKYKNSSKLSHKVLREILKIKYKIIIEEKDIYYNSDGKPYINSKYRIYFSISHSEKKLAIFISDKNVGVDIQYVDIQYKYNILKNLLNYIELEQIKEAANKVSLIYEYWVCKEAYAKFLGKSILKLDKDVYINKREEIYEIWDNNVLVNNIILQVYKISENYYLAFCLEKSL